MKIIVPLSIAWLAAAASASNAVSASPGYPTKPIRLIVVGPAGGGADVLARPLANWLSGEFRQQVIVDNRGGGGGIPGTLVALAAAPDGYTLAFSNAINMAVAPAMRRHLPYDPLTDFAPVTLYATTPLLVAVHPSFSVKSIKDLVAVAKDRPKQVLCASNGEGTIQHLTIELLNQRTGISLVHVPYKGGTPAVIDTVAGHTQMIVTAVPTAIAQVRASRLRALAVTSSKRASIVPDVPTVAESGWPDIEAMQWYGIFAPRKTPNPIIGRWAAAVQRAAETEKVKAAVSHEGAEVTITGPHGLAAFHRSDIARWQNVARESNIVLQ